MQVMDSCPLAQDGVASFLDSIEAYIGAVSGESTTTHWHGEVIVVVDE
jgi:hypothetical protein